MQFPIVLLALASTILAGPVNIRANKTVDPNAITGTTCNSDKIQVQHDVNVAILSICGGIAGAIQKCQGSPATTVGASGTATLDLAPVNKAATINVSKGRFEGCMRAAQAACPGTGFSSTCIGGTTDGDLTFSLKNA